MFEKPLWHSLIRFVSISRYPTLPCPYCKKKALTFDNVSFNYRELPCDSVPSKYLMHMFLPAGAYVGEIDVSNDFLSLMLSASASFEASKYDLAKFVCFFGCDLCGRQVSATGTAAIPSRSAGNDGAKIKVEYFSPTVEFFPMEDWIPTTISEELLRAFAYFHSDLTASGTKVRRALEQFCCELGYTQGSLHNRIEKMSERYPEESKWLLSLKWFGNEATHANDISEADLLHSFEILEELLVIFRRRSRIGAVQAASDQLDQKFRKP